MNTEYIKSQIRLRRYLAVSQYSPRGYAAANVHGILHRSDINLTTCNESAEHELPVTIEIRG